MARLAGSSGDEGIGVFVVPEARPRQRRTPPSIRTISLADLSFQDVEVGANRVLVEPGDSRAAEAIRRAWQASVITLGGVDGGHMQTHLRDDARVRQGPGAVRAADRFVPGAEAPLRRHVPRGGAGHVAGYFAALTIAEDDDRRAQAASWPRPPPASASVSWSGEGLQLHGGVGFTWEHDLHFLLKRAKAGDALLRQRRPPPGRAGPDAGLDVQATPRGCRHEAELYADRWRRSAPSSCAWLADNRPPTRRWRPTRRSPAPTRRSGRGEWTRRMFDAGWLVPGWPPELGGRNAAPIETDDLLRGDGEGARSPAPPTRRASASSPRRSTTTARAEQNERLRPADAARRDSPGASA